MRKEADTLCKALDGVILGKAGQVEILVAALLANGHLLIEDVPGTGKTTLAKALAQAIGAEFRRIQFTPDLMPADVTGGAVYQPATGQFVIHQGPVFANVLLADEINRASPRTQSALLEAMEERQVTLEGQARPLPELFIVLATQNPVEFHGVFPLPEAQMDRFLVRLELGYPDAETERRILYAHQKAKPLDALKPVMGPEHVLQLQAQVREVFVDQTVGDYIVRLVQETRKHPGLRLPASPRAGMVLFRLAQAFAWMDERDFVRPEDVQRALIPGLGHRIFPRDGRGAEASRAMLEEIRRVVPIPK